MPSFARIASAFSAPVMGLLLGQEDKRKREKEDADRARAERLDLIRQRLLETQIAGLQTQQAEASKTKELAGLQANRDEALQNERAADFQQRYGAEAVPSGLHPEIAIERGEAAEKRETEERGREHALKVAGMRTEASAATQEGVEYQRQFQRENALADDYARTVKPWEIPYNALVRGKGSMAEAKAGNSAAQLQMLYAFIQTLDNSVVKEGEAAMFARAAPYLSRAQMYADRINNKGAVMTATQVQEIADILTQVEQQFADRFASYKRYYQNRAKKWGIDPSSFMDIPETFGAGKDEEPEDEMTPYLQPGL
jgi:hypothetical protein